MIRCIKFSFIFSKIIFFFMCAILFRPVAFIAPNWYYNGVKGFCLSTIDDLESCGFASKEKAKDARSKFL